MSGFSSRLGFLVGQRGASAPDAFHSAIEAAKEATPYSKVTTKDRSARSQGDNGTDASLAMRRIAVGAVSTFWLYDVVVKRVPEPLYAMPNCPSDGLGVVSFETEDDVASCKQSIGLAPMQNAPPKSLRATQGQGSRLWSMDIVECHGV